MLRNIRQVKNSIFMQVLHSFSCRMHTAGITPPSRSPLSLRRASFCDTTHTVRMSFLHGMHRLLMAPRFLQFCNLPVKQVF